LHRKEVKINQEICTTLSVVRDYAENENKKDIVKNEVLIPYPISRRSLLTTPFVVAIS
jgi:hypothetical protein